MGENEMSYTDEVEVLRMEQKTFTVGSVSKVSETLKERGARYGDFTDHAKIAQDIQNAMRATDGWDNLDAGKKQALTVIADKIARILNGDPEYRDNWHDIQGYAKLAEDRCEGL